MTRDEVMARLQPLLEQLADEVLALSKSISRALLADLMDSVSTGRLPTAEPHVLVEKPTVEPHKHPGTLPTPRSSWELDGNGSTFRRTGTARHDDPPTTESRREQVEAATAPELTVHGDQRQRAVMKCKLCGELGKRSDSCGKTHNVRKPDETSPAARGEAITPPPEPSRTPGDRHATAQKAAPALRVDRFAMIQASAAARGVR